MNHICTSTGCSCEKKPMVNFHMHSSASSLDGCGHVSDYIKLAKEYNHPGLAITDHGNPAGLFDFYKQVKAAGLKPVLGEEFYLTTDLTIKEPNRKRDLLARDKHQTILIKNKAGYKNFCKLTYLSFSEGYYYKPRIDFDMLFHHKEGLIITSGCAASMFNQLINNEREREAEEWFKRFVNEIGENFYGEIQFNEIQDKEKFGMDQKVINDFILKMCNKYDVKVLIGGDTHYAYPEDARLQDILINCQRRKFGATESAESIESFISARHLYYHDSSDYYDFNKKFAYNYDEKIIDQALENSIELLDKVDFEFDTKSINFPKFRHEFKKTNEQLLEDLAYDGLLKKLADRRTQGEVIGDELIDEYDLRLKHELKIIKEKQITDYFLIVQDITNWAKDNGIRVGPSRGSVGGSLVAYAINIITIDAIKFGLYFERFQNPERVSLPDIDCLTENNYILLKDGSSKNILDITARDLIQCRYDCKQPLFINERELKDQEQVFQIETESGVILEFTENHIIPIIRENTYMEVKCKELTCEDYVIEDKILNMKLSKVKKIVPIVYKKKVYDIVFQEPGQLFYSSCNPLIGFGLTHNCDFSQGSREKIREYLEGKYGKEAVVGVGTHVLFKSKGALQDVSRGLGLDTSFGSVLMTEISKLPDIETVTDMRAFFDGILIKSSTTPTVQQWILENEETIKWTDRLLGQMKNLGTHAGGILITEGPVYDYIPVTKGSGEIVTAFSESDGSSKDLSELGLLKLDILGVKTLNVIQDSIIQIKQDLGIDISHDIDYINLENEKLIKCFAKGNNVGVFQYESDSINSLVKMIKPDCFDDLVAINGINRPGPLETFGPIYGKWKRLIKEGNLDECKKDPMFPQLDFMQKATERFYYCLIFQEQFMLMVCDAGGFNLGEADSFRRAIGWRKDHPKYHTVKKYFDRLEENMDKKGYSNKEIEYFLDYCRKFMGYSFNLSHSYGYSYLAMQTLYLKNYYPTYFYCNLLNIEPFAEYQTIISDALAYGVEVLPPSINKSGYDFKVDGNCIRVGLKCLKGFGDKAYEELVELEVGKCSDINEVLCLPFKKVNVKAFQALIDSGAFDEFGVEREKIETLKDLYRDKKIEKWFSRKSKPLTPETMPESLYIFPEHLLHTYSQEVKEEEEPHKKLITKLIPHLTIMTKVTEVAKEKKSEELLGFSLSMAKKVSKLVNLTEDYPDLNLKSISTRENNRDLIYWFVVDKTISKTKNGKSYLTLKITDKSLTIKAKCWTMINVEKGKAYVSRLEKDDWGYTIITDNCLTEIPLGE